MNESPEKPKKPKTGGTANNRQLLHTDATKLPQQANVPVSMLGVTPTPNVSITQVQQMDKQSDKQFNSKHE